MSKLLGEKLSLGVCYYPEHWNKSLWKNDLLRMLEHGIQTIRIAEFAWSKFEPTEGHFTYEFFDEFLELTEEVGMQVIFCTPTATPPAWLTHAYPEVLNVDLDGIAYQHGGRRHYNYNSVKYIELTKRIVEKIAAHYAQHKSIVGWQIDNELNCEKDVFYSESDTLAFRKFLKNKYQALDQLNDAWGTVFWNQTYTEWDEIYVPRKTPSNSNNPHLVLDYTRFISDSACNFAKIQSDIIRKYIKEDDFITTNGLFSNLDNHRMTEESLDFIMYDSYPNFAYCLGQDPIHSDDLNDRKWSKHLTEVRSISSNFGIMEQQSGPNGWNTRMEAPAPKPGQMTLWTMQSITHGADFVSFFRWRTCTVGTEIYWHGILDYSNRDNRRLKEVKDIHHKVESIKEIAGAEYEAKVAIVKDYDNIWDVQLDVWHHRVDSESQKGLFEALQLTHTPFDYIYLREDTSVKELQAYDVLFYPHATIVTEKTADILKDYVKNGGKLVVGCRTGYKDEHGRCVMLKLPGLLQELVDTDVEEYSFISPDDEKIEIEWDGSRMEAAVFTDLLQPLRGGKVLGNYCSDYYKGNPAIVQNSYGKGETYYFGSTFSRKTAITFLEKLGVANPYKEIIEVPEQCEVGIRVKDDMKYLFVLNYSKAPTSIVLKKNMIDMYVNTIKSGVLNLEGYETKVFKL